MSKHHIQAYKILTIALFIASCTSEKPRVDIEGSEVQLEVKRMEVDLFAETDRPLTAAEIETLKEKYTGFYPLFVEGILALGRAEDSTTAYYLN
ncbi:MAG: hypothetical protein RIC15_05200, partial [Vicingaceae bacterium]